MLPDCDRDAPRVARGQGSVTRVGVEAVKELQPRRRRGWDASARGSREPLRTAHALASTTWRFAGQAEPREALPRAAGLRSSSGSSSGRGGSPRDERERSSRRRRTGRLLGCSLRDRTGSDARRRARHTSQGTAPRAGPVRNPRLSTCSRPNAILARSPSAASHRSSSRGERFFLAVRSMSKSFPGARRSARWACASSRAIDAGEASCMSASMAATSRFNSYVAL